MLNSSADTPIGQPNVKPEIANIPVRIEQVGNGITMSSLNPNVIEAMSTEEIEHLAVEFIDTLLAGRDPTNTIVVVQADDSTARSINMTYCLAQGAPDGKNLIGIFFDVERSRLLLNQTSFKLNSIATLHPQLLAKIVAVLLNRDIETRVVFDWVLADFKTKGRGFVVDDKYLNPSTYMTTLYLALKAIDAEHIKHFKAALASMAITGTINNEAKHYIENLATSEEDPELAEDAQKVLEILQADSSTSPRSGNSTIGGTNDLLEIIAPNIPGLLELEKAPNAVKAKSFLRGINVSGEA